MLDKHARERSPWFSAPCLFTPPPPPTRAIRRYACLRAIFLLIDDRLTGFTRYPALITRRQQQPRRCHSMEMLMLWLSQQQI